MYSLKISILSSKLGGSKYIFLSNLPDLVNALSKLFPKFVAANTSIDSSLELLSLNPSSSVNN